MSSRGILLAKLAALAALILLVSCQAAGRDGSRAGDGHSLPVADEPYDGPPVTVDVLVQRYLEQPEYIAVVEVIAPTGGWEANLDDAAIESDDDDYEEEVGGTARLYITLRSPGADEAVTQALVAHHVTYRSTEAFEAAEVFVRLHPRGEAAGRYRKAQ